MKEILRSGLIVLVLTVFCTSCSQKKEVVESGTPKEVIAKVEGNLRKRMEQNSHRLEVGRYVPDSIYEIPSRQYHEEVWPGDLPGRLILGQTLLQKVSGREATYLKSIIDDLPNHFNELGYMGKIYKDILSEQQLSGHGWLLRGLCEYYLLTNDPVILGYLEKITNNLILPTAGHHKDYPIEPSLRKDAGGFMGTHEKMLDGWLLSSDVGCDFIFMDGVIQTYSILKTEELKAISYEMANRFLEADLYKIKAQTHATLTACRGLMRLYGLTGEQRFLEGAVERYDLYKKEGMTETYENFNWFQRPEWTEPCAVVDSYQLTLDLWKQTGEAKYLEDAQLIWYNAISYEQRDNGGFGLSNCPGPHDYHLETNAYEAHWCCTMRGSEGIAERVQSLYFKQGNSVILADFQSSEISVDLPAGNLSVSLKTDYPFEDKIDLIIKKSNLTKDATLKLFIPSWIQNLQLSIDGNSMDVIMDGSYLVIEGQFESGEQYELSFTQRLGSVKPHGNNTAENLFKIQYGPLVLGVEGQENDIKLPQELEISKSKSTVFQIEGTDITLNPVYHLMDEKVSEEGEYKCQVLFSYKN
jgi:hypothetical protein